MDARNVNRTIVPNLAIQKVSHILGTATFERLQVFAFVGHFSQSAVIEAALKDFFRKASDTELYADLKHRGYNRRRRQAPSSKRPFDRSKHSQA